MCGIAGLVTTNDQPPPTRAAAQRMVDALRHRGPDAQAVHLDGHTALGHARLSIIDLAGGDQPLFNEDRSVAVVCNGEIYNYRELRRELEAAGHRFRTHSDCETLVHLWEQHGVDMVDRLRGMFAFVLYDRNAQTHFGARDRFGQKPLYLRTDDHTLAFASEVKALLALDDRRPPIDPAAVDQFLFYQFVPQPRTLFQDIQQLPPGHCFLWRNGVYETRRYWEPSFDPQEQVDDQQCLDDLETELRDAVHCHMAADVPIGVFLSGGIDSSLMLALASQESAEPLETFSIAFPGTDADESPHARRASECFHSKHHEIDFQPSAVASCLESLADVFCQPLADSAAMPLYYLSRLASQSVKVVLTGDGGDELFAGYRKYKRAAASPGNSPVLTRWASALFPTDRLAACGPDPWGLRKLSARVGMAISPVQRGSYYRRYWEGQDRYRLYSPAMREQLQGSFETADPEALSAGMRLDPLNAMLRIDQASYLASDLLLKTDHATMAAGLEARAPLLDHHLAAFAGRLPGRLKATAKQTKVALRKIAARVLPEELYKRPKKGFSFPISDWFRGELRPWVRKTLIDDSTTCPLYFQRSHVERVLGEHETGRRDHGGRIYSLLAFELWNRRFGPTR